MAALMRPRQGSVAQIVEELKELGFDSSTSPFSVALLAKGSVSETSWAEKIDTFKRWGWSEQQVLQAFKKQPYCMLTSIDKINAVMSFWVDQLGLNSLDLVKAPSFFQWSLEKRIIPRASVVQFLVSKGLREKGAGITTPFTLSEKLFLERFVKCFKEDSSHLLKMYQEKMNLANSREKPSPSA
ncbi:Transcription termination factor, mitochondrial/chloroplastic [Sesbania bispinosa]|nr:Transcription termination factor, mitochondrial/chloroplastic [Sesbania bispinosa]